MIRTLRTNGELAVWRLTLRLARSLPEPVADLVCQTIAWLVLAIAPRTRQAVTANLDHVLPAGTAIRRLLRTRTVLYHTARTYYDLLRAPTVDLDRHFTLQGREHLAAALAEGRGAIIVTAHLGSIPLAPLYAASLGFPVTLVIEQLAPPERHRFVEALRGGGMLRTVVANAGSGRSLLAALRRGEVVVLAADRDVTGSGAPVPFFGRHAVLATGPSLLALVSGAPIVPAFTWRLDRHHSVLRVWPALARPATTDRATAQAQLRETIAQALEEAIRLAPLQWTVLQPIWPPRDGPPRSRA